jgi:hypothetical protein
MPVSKIQDYVTKVDYIQQYLDGTVKIKFDHNKTTIPPVFTEKFNNKINTSRDGATWGPKGAMAPAGSKKKKKLE